MRENLYIKPLTITAADCDMFGRLRPATMLRLIQGAGFEQAELFGLGNDRIWGQGLLWVIGRTVAEIRRLPGSDEQLELLTWPGKSRKIFLPRSYELRTPDGETLVQTKSIFLLLNAADRHTVTPASIGLEIPECHGMNELEDPAPRIHFPNALDGQRKRSPQYSELDLNGHLNNTHYLSWCEDLLSVDYHRDHYPRSFWIEYRKEVRPENEVQMNYTLQDNTLFVDGGGFFTLKMEYKEA